MASTGTNVTNVLNEDDGGELEREAIILALTSMDSNNETDYHNNSNEKTKVRAEDQEGFGNNSSRSFDTKSIDPAGSIAVMEDEKSSVCNSAVYSGGKFGNEEKMAKQSVSSKDNDMKNDPKEAGIKGGLPGAHAVNAETDTADSQGRKGDAVQHAPSIVAATAANATVDDVNQGARDAAAKSEPHSDQPEEKLDSNYPEKDLTVAVGADPTIMRQQDDDEQEEVAHPGMPQPPTLERRNRISHVSHPGAVAVYPDSGHFENVSGSDARSPGTTHENETFTNNYESQVNGENGGANLDDDMEAAMHNNQATSSELLLNATLVDERDEQDNQLVVEAEPALKGFHAIVANTRFKYLAALFVLILLAVVIPVALLTPSSGQTITKIALSGPLVCGRRDIKQTDYRGTIAVTETGKTCQPWAAQEPHSHSYDPSNFDSTGLESNYCRNPEGDAKPWCYTMDPESRWEWCDVPYCEEANATVTSDTCGSTKLYQTDYRGNISVTASGKQCQRWDSMFPHEHGNYPEVRPTAGLEDNNYCRNPDNGAHPFCYTTLNSTRWEYCDIPPCGRTDYRLHNVTSETASTETCGSESQYQRDYRGNISVTATGRVCQRWDQQEPHRHTIDPELAANADLRENYCRNFEGSLPGAAAFCYTTDPLKSIEFCEVPYCPDNSNDVVRRKCGTLSKSQVDYRGDLSTSVSGSQCLMWVESVQAITLGLTQNKHPWAGLVGNFCRNPTPDERQRAWCFVGGNNDTTWDYCDVDDCQECGTPSLRKSDYLGTVSTTISGKTCLPWLDRQEELLQYNLTYYEFEENYCRNSFLFGDDKETVWCYVAGNSSSDFEYCEVPDCGEDEDPMAVAPSTSVTCGSLSVEQANYRGPINVTIGGLACQSWSSQEPHQHKHTPEDWPEAGLGNGTNACRNPDGSSGGAWCYTNDSNTLWDYCDIPYCPEP